jgi:hypothetical protein
LQVGTCLTISAGSGTIQIRFCLRPIAVRPASTIATVEGSGTAVRPGAVICPEPVKDTGDNSFGPGGGLLMPVEVALPVAPLNIPVPPRIVIALVIV